MSRKHTIRHLLAGVLLLIFSFSITPKKFLHDALANHKDKVPVAAGVPQYSHTGFVCKCDNLVAESAFTNEIIHIDFNSYQVFKEEPGIALYHYHSSPQFFSGLRGPPASY